METRVVINIRLTKFKDVQRVFLSGRKDAYLKIMTVPELCSNVDTKLCKACRCSLSSSHVLTTCLT